MEWERGRVVCSKAGRDAGSLLAVIGREGDCLIVADGKQRPLGRPKRKKPRHLQVTGTVLEEDALRSDRALRRALQQL